MFRRWLVTFVVFFSVALSAGCSMYSHHHADGPTVPAYDSPASRGLLLQTGAIQLGPGVGNNAYSWQGDNHSPF